MNKVKMFFLAAALVLTTAGVFAGKAKFVNYSLWAYNTTTGYFQLESTAAALVDLTTTAGGSQAKIVSSNHPSDNYFIYGLNGVTYSPLYTINF